MRIRAKGEVCARLVCDISCIPLTSTQPHAHPSSPNGVRSYDYHHKVWRTLTRTPRPPFLDASNICSYEDPCVEMRHPSHESLSSSSLLGAVCLLNSYI